MVKQIVRAKNLLVIAGVLAGLFTTARSAVAQTPATAAPAQATAAPTPEPAMSRSRPLGPAHRGGMAIPFLGVHTIQGDAGRYYDPGLRVGLLGGGYATERASLNVELALDWSNRGEQPGVDVDATQFMGDLAFSPLFHAPLGAVELVVGPKLGAWYSYMHADLPILGATTTTAHGWTLGTNGGVLFPTSGSMAAGVLLSYQFRDPTEACTNSSSSQFKVCQGSGDAIHILGFNAALMF